MERSKQGSPAMLTVTLVVDAGKVDGFDYPDGVSRAEALARWLSKYDGVQRVSQAVAKLATEDRWGDDHYKVDVQGSTSGPVR